MFKKISTITVLSATLLLGGVFNTSVDAAAESGQSKNQTYKVYHSINSNWDTYFNWQKLSDYFNQFQINHKDQENGYSKPLTKEEQPKQEEPKTEKPVEQVPVEQQVPKQEQQNQEQVEGLSEFEQEVVELTNNERAKNGLSPLQADPELSRVAREKSRDMSARNYFDHNSPTYGSPFDMMESYGITYQAAGENIAKGQRTPQEVVTAWMNSPGHRANILNGNFTHIGSGFFEQGNHWTQMFIGK